MSKPYKLYTFYRSSTAWRARIALNLKKIKPEYVFVHLLKGDQKTSKYSGVNPNQGVPTLQLPNGDMLIESMAIIQYLDEVHPTNPKLFAGDAVKRAKIRGFCEVVNSGIHPYQNIRLLDKVQADFKADKMNFARYWVLRGMDTMESIISKTRGTYAFGDQITAADVFLYPQVSASIARWNADITKYHNLRHVLENLKKIKEFVDAQPKNQPDFEQ